MFPCIFLYTNNTLISGLLINAEKGINCCLSDFLIIISGKFSFIFLTQIAGRMILKLIKKKLFLKL